MGQPGQGAARSRLNAAARSLAHAGTLASTFHAKATTGTIRAQLITVPGRLARSARRLVLYLPTHWPWQTAWTQMAQAAREGPPLAA